MMMNQAQLDEVLNTTCCIVGGGPAGIMLGYLLARRRVRVTVLEKHNDFLRDFRGDTVHPSTLQVLHELGLLDDFLKIPHQKVTSVGGTIGDYAFQVADVTHVPGCCKFVALMPQWDFLNFLSKRAAEFPSFELRMRHEAIDLVTEGARVAGAVARGPNDSFVKINADLVVGCDGRHATTRKAGRFEVRELGVPIDVLWFRISRRPQDRAQVFGTFNYGKALILINRGDYFQAGMIIRKGAFDQLRAQGLDEFRSALMQLAPFFEHRVEELCDWDQVKLLTVQINRLKHWFRDGLLCIGDAAHAMSPAGGVGINLAIQDAVATANLLTDALLRGRPSMAELQLVERRREFPTRVIQAMQVNIHKQMARIFDNPGPAKAPRVLRIAVRIPGVHRVLGYAVGVGIRPEHVQDGVRHGSRRWVRAAAKIGVLLGGIVAGLTVAQALRSRRSMALATIRVR